MTNTQLHWLKKEINWLNINVALVPGEATSTGSFSPRTRFTYIFCLLHIIFMIRVYRAPPPPSGWQVPDSSFMMDLPYTSGIYFKALLETLSVNSSSITLGFSGKSVLIVCPSLHYLW